MCRASADQTEPPTQIGSNLRRRRGRLLVSSVSELLRERDELFLSW